MLGLCCTYDSNVLTWFRMGDGGQQHEPPKPQQHAPIVQQIAEDQMAIMHSMSARIAIIAFIANPVLSYKTFNF